MFEHPCARADLITESVEDGAVIYVPETHQARYLDDAATVVWDACDGKRSVEDLARDLNCDDATITATLARLADSGLLATASRAADEPIRGLSDARCCAVAPWPELR